MRKMIVLAAICLSCVSNVMADSAAPQGHPDTTGWKNLFAKDLSDATYPKGVWYFEGDVLTATKDQNIWTNGEYENFIVDLEFKNEPGTNSGVIVYASDLKNWIPNSVEIQIADDHAAKWAKCPKSWQCAAAFGHQGATRSVVKKPGEWNHMTVTCKGPTISVVLNGEQVTPDRPTEVHVGQDKSRRHQHSAVAQQAVGRDPD